MLIDIPPLDPKLPSAIEGTVASLCAALKSPPHGEQRAEGIAQRDLRLLKDSGLLSLAVPAQFGGKGASWGTIFDIVRRLVRVDSTVAERLTSQCLQLGTLQILGSPEQQGDLLFGTAQGDWLWGSTTHANGTRLRATISPSGVEINGVASTPAALFEADHLIVSAQMLDGSGTVIAAVSAGSSGVLRQAARIAHGDGLEAMQGIELRRLQVSTGDLLGGVLASASPRATLRPLLDQLCQIHLFLGVAQGALECLLLSSRSARRGSLSLDGDGEPAPAVQQRFADLWVDLKAALVLTRSATRSFEDAWLEGDALDGEERGRLAIEIGEARTLASRAGLQLTQAIFEAAGAGAAASPLEFDGWRRRLRAHSLSDPVDFRRRELGRWLLRGDLPRASLFS